MPLATFVIPPVPIPFTVSFGGSLALKAGALNFGFDTFGLTNNDPSTGFYINGKNPIFTINPGLTLDLTAQAVIASGTAKIGIDGNVNLFLPGKPEKFRISDTTNFSGFDIEGGNVDLFGSVEGRIGVGFFSKTFGPRELFRTTLFDFENSGRSSAQVKPNLADDSTSPNLYLNIGLDSNKRNINKDEINEDFRILVDTNNANKLIVSAFGSQKSGSTEPAMLIHL